MISCESEVASPQHRDVAVKPATQVSSSRFRPIWLAGHPGIGNTIAFETRYEEGFLLRKCLAAVTPARQLSREGKLETKLRTKRNPQVIVSSAVEIAVVANLSAKTNGAGKNLNSAARIDSEVRGAVRQTDCVDESSLRILIVNAEVVESNFAGHEHSNRS
jgi:hypothetical protein